MVSPRIGDLEYLVNRTFALLEWIVQGNYHRCDKTILPFKNTSQEHNERNILFLSPSLDVYRGNQLL